MKKTIILLLIVPVVLLASCSTVDYRKVKLLENGSVNRALIIRKDSRVFLTGDTILLKRIGENKWAQNFNTLSKPEVSLKGTYHLEGISAARIEEIKVKPNTILSSLANIMAININAIVVSGLNPLTIFIN